MRKIILSGVYLFLAAGLFAQTAVLNVKDNSESMKDDPVATYFLPRTVLEIEVEVTKIIRKAGPYAGDAIKYLGAPAGIQKDEEFWKISKIKVKQKSEPDAGNQFKVYANTNSNATLLSLTETGILKGINLPSPFSSKAKKEGRNSNKSEKKKGKKEKSGKSASSSLFISDFVIKEGGTEKKADAAIAFDQINTLREARLNILSQNNDVLQKGSAVKAYLSEIDKREKELTALFNGKERKEVVKKTFTVYPDKEITKQDLFRFSEKQGFSDSGNPVTITLKKKETGAKTVFPGKSKTGFVYRMPALVDVEISGDKTVLWSGAISIAQLGRLAYLPVGFFDKNDVKALFDTKSGAILQIVK